MLNKLKKNLELFFLTQNPNFQKNRNFDSKDNLNNLINYIIQSNHFKYNFPYLANKLINENFMKESKKPKIVFLKKNLFNYQISKKIYNFLLTANFNEKSFVKDFHEFLNLYKFLPYYFNYNNKTYYLNYLAILIYVLHNKKVKLNLENHTCRSEIIHWFSKKNFYSNKLDKIKKKLFGEIKFLTKKNSLFKLFNVNFFLVKNYLIIDQEIFRRLFSNEKRQINELLRYLVNIVEPFQNNCYENNINLNKINNQAIYRLFLNLIKDLPHLRHLNYGEDYSNNYFNKSNNSQLEFWSKSWGWEERYLFKEKLKRLKKKNVDNINLLMFPVDQSGAKIFAELSIKPVSANIINIVGFFGDDRAIGFDCDCVKRIVKNLGFEVNILNLNLEREFNDKNFDQLFPGYLSIFIFPLAQYANFICKYGYNFFKNRLNILLCQTELNKLSKHYLCLNNKYIKEIWAISNFSKKGLKKIFKQKTIKIMPLLTEPVINKEKKKSFFSNKKNDFIFFTSFDLRSSILRKNPHATVFAFKRAFDKNKFKNAKLIINTRYCDIEVINNLKAIINNDTRIKILNKKFSRDEFYLLIKSSDCFVSLHRSEGFGRNIADALYFNKKVIVSNYSGSKDFTLSKYCNLVRGKLIRIKPYEYDCVTSTEIFYWFDPDIEHASKLMRKVFFDKKRINVSHEFIKKKYGEKSVSRFLFKRIKILCKDKLKFNFKLNPYVHAAEVEPSQHYIDYGNQGEIKYK